MPCLTSLPDEVLKLVMQHVPLADRLGSCCLVNSRLHAAAVAATAYVRVPGNRVGRGLQWLSHYGHHVTALTMYGPTKTLQQLPCPNLRDLVFHLASSVQLGPSDDGQHPGVLQDCTKLTRLRLWNVHLSGVPEGGVVDCLSSLVHLRHLECLPRGDRGCALSGATLPRLQHLTHLGLRGMSDENLLQLGGLTRLQQLQLGGNRDTAVGPVSLPGLALPAPLTRLVLSVRVEAALLALVPAGLRHLDICRAVEGPADGPGCLLSCIARLQQLTTLVVQPKGGVLALPPPGPAYAALTASSSLVELGWCQAPMPAGVWPHVFPASRQLRNLTKLNFADTWDVDGPDPPAAWGPADLALLVGCCPGLHTIGGMFLQHGAHVSQLQQLTALDCLGVHYGSDEEGDCPESLQGLAGLTQLDMLEVHVHGVEPEVAALLPLTRLMLLNVLSCLWSETDEWNGLYMCLSTMVENGHKPVWLQLLARCVEDPDCHPSALLSLGQQLAELRTLATQQQQQLGELRPLATQQQQQLAAQQEQIAAQQQQIATQEEQIATLLRLAAVQQPAAAEGQGAQAGPFDSWV